MPLTREEEASLAELEAEVAAAAPPLAGKVRVDRFSGAPVGMRDDGTLFPLTPDVDDEGAQTPPAPPSK